MRITAKADYAVRAALELAGSSNGEPMKGESLASAQGIPLQFLEHIMLDLKHHDLVRAKRGMRGGYWLSRSADEITVADVIRAVEGPLAHVHDEAPETTTYGGNAEHLRDVWIAVRGSIRTVLDGLTLDQVRRGELPSEVQTLLESPEAWRSR